MHLVRDPDRLRRPDLADAEPPDRRQLMAREDRADQARQVVLVSDRGEHLVDSLVGLDRRPAMRRRRPRRFLATEIDRTPAGPERQPFGRHGSEKIATVDHDRIGSGSSRLGCRLIPRTG